MSPFLRTRASFFLQAFGVVVALLPLSFLRADDFTPVRAPLAVESNEATKDQLESARGQGKAARDALDWLVKAAPYATEMDAGEYHIACIVSAPEGWYAPAGRDLQWHGASRGNAHLRFIIRDGADGRVIPYLTVRARIFDRGGAQIQTVALPFGWYPLLNGYGENVRLPRGGSVRVEIDPPQFHRHDPYNGDRFTQPTFATFSGLRLSPNDMSSSDREAGQLPLAKAQGDAYAKTVQVMFEQATDGKKQRVGDYIAVVAVEYAEAWWFYEDNKFVYKYEEELSATHNAHIEVAPCDGRTGRFLPAENVTATVVGAGETIGPFQPHFMWHPWLYHYGDNCRVPHGGRYRIVASWDPPAYRRYGREAGRRFAQPVQVTFDNIKIETGEK